jgi:hypothetical protein
MAFAFGIQYGLDDIRRANEAITRELEQQLAITQRLASESRMVTGRSAYTLGAGPTVAGNAVAGKVAEERRIDEAIDRRIRKESSLLAGTSRGMSAGGRFAAIRGVTDLLRGGGGGVESGIQALRLGADALRGTSLGGMLAGAAPLLGIAAGAAPFAIGAASQIAAAFTGETAREYAAALKRARASAKAALPAIMDRRSVSRLVDDLIENEASFAPGLQSGLYEDHLLAQAGMAGDVAGRIGALSSRAGLVSNILNQPMSNYGTFAARDQFIPVASGSRAGVEAGLAGGSGRSIRGTPEDVAKVFMALAKTGQASKWLTHIEKKLVAIDARERAQAELFSNDPDLASRHQQRMRLQKREERREASALQDWSRS